MALCDATYIIEIDNVECSPRHVEEFLPVMEWIVALVAWESLHRTAVLMMAGLKTYDCGACTHEDGKK